MNPWFLFWKIALKLMPAYFVVELVSYYVPHYEGEVAEHFEPWTVEIADHILVIEVVNALNLEVDIMNFIVATTELTDYSSITELIEYNATIDLDADVLAADIPEYSTEVFIEPYSTTMES